MKNNVINFEITVGERRKNLHNTYVTSMMILFENIHSEKHLHSFQHVHNEFKIK